MKYGKKHRKTKKGEMKTYDLQYGKNIEKRVKLEIQSDGPLICLETEKNVKKWVMHTVWLRFGEKTEKHGKWDTNTVWSWILRETMKDVDNEKHKL